MASADPFSIDLRCPAGFPGVRATYFRSDTRLWRGVKEHFSVIRVYEGRSEWRCNGRVLSSGVGSIDLKQPNEVHEDLYRDGPAQFQIVTFTDDLIDEAVRASSRPSSARLQVDQLPHGHPDHPIFDRLHAALRAPTIDLLSLQTIVTDALSAFVRQFDGRDRPLPPRAFRPQIRRAVDHIHAHLAERLTLGAIAQAAGLDRFQLCRAFREEVGLPPYVYVTELRVVRARQLLSRGLQASEVAARLGFCDQSQLHRHFRRSTGLAPGAYARLTRPTRPTTAFAG